MTRLMLLTMTAYTGPEAFDRRFSIAKCYFEDADMSKYCSYLLHLRYIKHFCSHGKSYWSLFKLLYKTEYNLCDNFEALSRRSFDQKLIMRFLIVIAIGNRPSSP